MTRKANRPALELAGSSKHQEANRKRLIRRLKSIRQDAEWQLKRTTQLLEFFDCDISDAAARRPEALRDALTHAARNGASFSVARILGLDKSTEENIVHALWNIPHPSAGMTPAASTMATTKAAPESDPTFSANAALQAANAIIARLGDDVEIDWRRDPLSERERELRAAMIRRAEIEGTTGSCLTGPNWVLINLSALGNGCPVKIGGDLWLAHKKWSALSADKRASEQRAKIEQAKRDVEAGRIEGQWLQ